MESLDESSRFENGCLSRDLESIVAVAAMQRLFYMETEDA